MTKSQIIEYMYENHVRGDHAIESMAEDLAQQEPHWIPCSERLPEKNCRCLVTNDARGAFEVDWNTWFDGRWLHSNDKPIAWMPLPKPYGGESDETDRR